MAVRLLLIRHAEAETNLQAATIGGRSNHARLTADGVRQADVLGRALCGNGLVPDLVLASPAERARRTAALALAAMECDLPVRIDDRLQELCQGQWTGKPRRDVYTPETLAAIAKHQLDFAAPGGESMRQVGARMVESLTEAVGLAEAEMPEALVIAFGHGIAIRCFAGLVRTSTHEEILRGSTPNVSVTTAHHRHGGFEIEDVGRVVV